MLRVIKKECQNSRWEHVIIQDVLCAMKIGLAQIVRVFPTPGVNLAQGH